MHINRRPHPLRARAALHPSRRSRTRPRSAPCRHVQFKQVRTEKRTGTPSRTRGSVFIHMEFIKFPHRTRLFLSVPSVPSVRATCIARGQARGAMSRAMARLRARRGGRGHSNSIRNNWERLRARGEGFFQFYHAVKRVTPRVTLVCSGGGVSTHRVCKAAPLPSHGRGPAFGFV